MKVMITGGHFSPALAVIEKFPPTVQVVYVGRKHAIEKDAALSLEYQEVTKRGIPFRIIQPGRLHRIIHRNTLSSFLRVMKGFIVAKKIIEEEKPDVILSFGSYVALPLCMVGYFKHIPVILHEQTFEAGLTTQFLSHFATKICVSWESSAQLFPKAKTLITGNPAFSSLEKMHTKKPTAKNAQILITGGNMGSHVINITVAQILPELIKNYTVVHQTGDAKEFQDYDMLIHMRHSFSPARQASYTVEKFFSPHELNELQAHADLVISRAGANTIGELFILGRPTIVIPIPNTQRNEQEKNAQFLLTSGLAQIIEQSTLSPQLLLHTVHDMMDHITQYKRKPAYEKRVNDHTTAAQTLADLVQKIGSSTSS